MRGMIRFIPVILMLLAATAAGQDFNVYGFSTIDFSYLGGGARARAMGAAFTGVADDASALTWNPAGLIQVDRTQTSISGSYQMLEQSLALIYSSGSGSTFDAVTDDDKLKLRYASFVAPLRIKDHPFMTSVSFRAIQDLLQEWYSWTSFDDFFKREMTDTLFYDVTRTHHTQITGGLDAFSLGFGTGLYEDLSVGFALNIYSGSGNSFYHNEYDTTVISPPIAGESDTIHLVRAQTVEDDFNQKGFNFTGALFYRAEKFRAGLKVETPFELLTEHDVAKYDTMYVNDKAQFDNFNDPIGLEGRGELIRGKTKFKVPLSVTGGVSYQVTPNLLVSGDVEMRRFSKSTYSIKRSEADSLLTQRGSIYFPYHCDVDTCEFSHITPTGKEEDIYDEFNPNFHNSVRFGIGAEYMLETKIGVIPLRGGLCITKMQYTDVTNVNRDDLDQVQRGFKLEEQITHTAITLGTGIHWRQIWLDLAVEIGSEEQKESGTNTNGTYQLTRERKNPTISLNFTGFF